MANEHDNDNDHILYTRWLRVAWNESVLAFGIGFDPFRCIFGLYLGPVSVFIGDAEMLDED